MLTGTSLVGNQNQENRFMGTTTLCLQLRLLTILMSKSGLLVKIIETTGWTRV